MSFSLRVRQYTLPLIAAFISSSLLVSSPVFANDPPIVTVDGAGSVENQPRMCVNDWTVCGARPEERPRLLPDETVRHKYCHHNEKPD